MEYRFFKAGAHPSEQNLSRFGNAAAEDDCLRIQRVAEIRSGSAKHLERRLHHSKRKRVSVLCGVNHVLCRERLHLTQSARLAVRLQLQTHAANQPGRGGILLQTAALSAAANFLLVRADADVADLAGRAVVNEDDIFAAAGFRQLDQGSESFWA